jgi:hypothetical protein
VIAARAVAFAVVLMAATGGGPGVALAQGMILNINIRGPNLQPVRPKTPVNTLQDLMGALVGCWSPPQLDPARESVDVTFQISFKRSGELFGTPQAIIFPRPVTTGQRERYSRAVADALELCSQMPFTETMGAAVAGRVFRVNLIDARNRIRADIQWPTPKTR